MMSHVLRVGKNWLLLSFALAIVLSTGANLALAEAGISDYVDSLAQEDNAR